MNNIFFPFESCRILWNTENFSLFGIDFGARHIAMYPLTATIATILVTVFAYYLWNKKNLSRKDFFWMQGAAILGIFCGARFFGIFFFNDFGFIQSCIELFNPHHSAFSSPGGFVGGLLFVWLVAKWRKINLWKFTDCFALGFGIAFAIGRIGCFCNPCCYGKLTNVSWGVDFFGDGLRHPTQIYDMINALFVFVVAWINKEKEKFFGMKTFDGFLTFLCLMIYSGIRFFIQFFREDPVVLFGLQFSHFVYFSLFVFAAIMFWNKGKFKNKDRG